MDHIFKKKLTPRFDFTVPNILFSLINKDTYIILKKISYYICGSDDELIFFPSNYFLNKVHLENIFIFNLINIYYAFNI